MHQTKSVILVDLLGIDEFPPHPSKIDKEKSPEIEEHAVFFRHVIWASQLELSLYFLREGDAGRRSILESSRMDNVSFFHAV